MSLDTSAADPRPADTVELMSVGNSPGDAVVAHLDVTMPAAAPGCLWRWESQVSAALQVGVAQVVTIPLETADLPVGVVVGGWPMAEPCCVGSPAPTSDNVMREVGWYCERCGDTIEPERWAAMSLETDPTGAWKLPDPAVFAVQADTALRELLAARQIDAAQQASQRAAAAERGQARPCKVQFAVPRKAGTDAPTPWQPTAVVSTDLDDDGHALVLFGHWGPTDDKPPSGRRHLELGFHDVGARVAMRPAQLLGLLGAGSRLAEEVAARRLSAERLSSAWLLAAGAAPEWLTTPAVMDQIAAIGNQRLAERAEQARAAERSREGLQL